MDKKIRMLVTILGLITAVVVTMVPGPVLGDTAAKIDNDVDIALEKLYADSPAAKDIAKVAKAILVFPYVVKAGFLVGGQYGEGALRVEGKTVGYYNTAAGSYGWQAGAQSFGYALFFMNESALDYLNKSAGWEIGVGPSIVVVEKGLGTSLTSSTVQDDIYAFFFSRKGLMGGLGIQGSKITEFTPKQ
jgi:lipid-binding SYLF domain-containing protein